MKKKISISIEEEKIDQIEKYAKFGSFRNRSHLIEFAIEKLMEEYQNEA